MPMVTAVNRELSLCLFLVVAIFLVPGDAEVVTASVPRAEHVVEDYLDYLDYFDCAVYEDLRAMLSFALGFFCMGLTKQLTKREESGARGYDRLLEKAKEKAKALLARRTTSGDASAEDDDGWALSDAEMDTLGTDAHTTPTRGEEPPTTRTAAREQPSEPPPGSGETSSSSPVMAFKLYPFVM